MPNGPSGPIFISHASADDAFVRELRETLEAHRLPVWVDSRNLRGGSKLESAIEEAIENARMILVVLSPNSVNSPWVRREIKKALEVEKAGNGYVRIIPLLLPGITPAALGNWFDEEPVAISIRSGVGALSEALPSILAALGQRLPTDFKPHAHPEVRPLEELILTLTDPRVTTQGGVRRLAATAILKYEPAAENIRAVESRRYTFTAPLGPIERDDLRWYLETYFLWPTGVFRTRAEGIEKKLPEWGHALYRAAMGGSTAREPLHAWQSVADGAERRFSVLVDSELAEETTEEEQRAAREAAADLLGLPWELLHDGHGWLFQGKRPARVRRRLPNRQHKAASITGLPIRVLLLSPRPEHDGKGNPVGYIDHRASARPLVEAVEGLGELVRLTVLTSPTYVELQRALHEGVERGEPYDVVHFDGHGVYDRKLGLGGLCFESPTDQGKRDGRAVEFVDAVRLAGLFRQHRIPLVFLEACQTAMASTDPIASVAASLLDEGIASVVAMSHSVLVETARRFVTAFYGELTKGARVGQAMLAGQRTLFGDAWRGKVMGAGELRLQDWFVPVIYQEEQDPQLASRIPADEHQLLEARRRRISLGALPEPPSHFFQGRSREMLVLERLLSREPWAVVRGTGGAGKTTLAVELARWLTRTGRFSRAAFVSLEHHREVRVVLDTLGHQLLPNGDHFSVAQFSDLNAALQPIERALADSATIIVIDNCESVLPQVSAQDPEDSAAAGIFALCQSLLAAHPATRLVFTTRERLLPPFDDRGRECELGALALPDAIELVSQVMAQQGIVPLAADAGGTPQEIADLVDAVNRHARALVLLAQEIARSGVKVTTGNLRTLMIELERRHPGNRENSLYASVELSLRRLPNESREKIQCLAACHGGISLAVFALITRLEFIEARNLMLELVKVGLGGHVGHGYLLLDPALPPYLLTTMPDEDIEALRAQWAEAMSAFIDFLVDRQHSEVRHVRNLALLELPNLLSLLEWSQERWTPTRVVVVAQQVEGLLADLGRPHALQVASQIRQTAANGLNGWSRARYVADSTQLERLIEQRDLVTAQTAAAELVQSCLSAGEQAYSAAAFDIASAHFLLGRVLLLRGAVNDAFGMLTKARELFAALSEKGSEDATRMISVVSIDIGDGLVDLGRLDEAVATYEQMLEQDRSRGHSRDVAITNSKIATVRMLQGRYDDALIGYYEAREIFSSLREPVNVATCWHNIGVVSEHAKKFEQAEDAYRQALAIRVRENDVAGQADTLTQLGSIYAKRFNLEDAVTFYRQAAEIFIRLQDSFKEAAARQNLAITLADLKRYDEARQEIERAVECASPFGHAAKLWKSWAFLELMERSIGNADAAAAARQQAFQTYTAYRHEGGFSESDIAPLYRFAERLIQYGATAAATKLLDQIVGGKASPHHARILAKIKDILGGNLDSTFSADPELSVIDAAELALILERLSRSGSTP